MTVIKNIARDRVLQITALLVVISLFLGAPQINDIHFSTLWSITAMMTLIQVFEYLHVLDFFTYKLTSSAANTRQLTWKFVILALFSGMFLTNDVTVLTLIPLYLKIANKYKLPEAVPVTLIGMAANFGSAFTPFGNPHNIFIMDHYLVNGLEFFRWSIPLLVASVILLFIFSLFIKNQPVPTVPVRDIQIYLRPTLISVGVALLIFAGVFRVVPSYVGALAAILLAVLFDPKIMLHVDYAIILTFTGFFMIAGIVSRVPLVVSVISHLMYSETSVYLTSIISSQFMSNVPSTVLIGKFSPFAEALFLGSNIGGLGSVIGSMANLLVFKQYANHGRNTRAYFLTRSAILQFTGLIILSAMGYLILIKIL